MSSKVGDVLPLMNLPAKQEIASISLNIFLYYNPCYVLALSKHLELTKGKINFKFVMKKEKKKFLLRDLFPKSPSVNINYRA